MPLTLEYDPARAMKYRIVDTCFIEDCTVMLRDGVGKTVGPDLAVIDTYSKKNRNIAKALADMYIFYAKKNSYSRFFEEAELNRYKVELEKYYPELNFEKKYYKCMLRYLKEMQVTWRKS
jgi:hypothetical protein